MFNRTLSLIVATSFTLSICQSNNTAFAAQAESKKRKVASVQRPPQYVLFAFDGSKNNDFWRESMAFADTVDTVGVTGDKKKLRFSYYINPSYYIEEANKSAYRMPQLNRPYSCIGWSSKTLYNSFIDRIKNTNEAFKKGHEIGSHAISHCNAQGSEKGSKTTWGPWSEADWTQEFSQFNDIIFNVFSVNKVKPPSDFVQLFTKADITGFRAPQLGITPGLFPTLKKFNFQYDTSKVNKPDYWPEKDNWGGWNIPLARIKMAGTSKSTLSMDFNWFVSQTGGVEVPNITPQKIKELKTQMLDSYKYYFKKNYYGNRAPVQIGHHFSKWNGGAYWEAMKEFAQFVCAKPEVRCVTIAEYTYWLEKLNSNDLMSYRKGDFPKLKDPGDIKEISSPVVVDVQLLTNNNEFHINLDKHNQQLVKSMGFKTQLSVNFKPVSGHKISLDDVVKTAPINSTAIVRASVLDRRGREISWQSYKIKNIGTAEQVVGTEPVENLSLQADPPEAHAED